MKTKICPACGDEHPVSATYCGCGHKWTVAAPLEHRSVVDPMHGCCEWVSDGQRCHYPGAVSDSTVGGGRWFCRHHHGLADAAHGARIVEHSHRDVPSPDYSLEARRSGSERAARARVPRNLYGWTLDEYRSYARKMVDGIGKGVGKPWPEKALDRVRAGDEIPSITSKLAADWFRKQGRDDDAQAVSA